MILTRHARPIDGALEAVFVPERAASNWAVDGEALASGIALSQLLAIRQEELFDALKTVPRDGTELGKLQSPIGPLQEVWACGVTYLRSRIEREAESSVADVYAKVYEAERPEVFFKSVGWRVRGHGETVRVRKDSTWNVPEPELTLVVNRWMEIVGYTVGNDMSSRSIEGENPLYLPQAKTYDGACALGPGIVIAEASSLENLAISISIMRGGQEVFSGEANTSQMKRSLADLVEYVGRETSFPNGVFVMTGTGIIPPSDFTLASQDLIRINIGELTLENTVE